MQFGAVYTIKSAADKNDTQSLVHTKRFSDCFFFHLFSSYELNEFL